MKIENKKNVAIIRLSSLGDIILTTPFIRDIKKTYPDINIDFILKSEYKSVLLHNPYIRNIMEYNGDDNNINGLNEILKNKYDLIIDLQNNLRSKKLCKSVKVPIVKFKKYWFKKLLLVKFKINKMKNLPGITERYSQTVEDILLDDKGPEIFLPEETTSLLSSDQKYIGFCPGSKHITKMWPINNYIILGNYLANLGYTIVLFGGKEDKEICKYMSIYLKKCINLTNDNDLYQTLTDIKKCEFIVCNDSGMMHAATSMSKPVISLFGSTVKEFGFAPYKTKSIIVEAEELKCRPCTHIGRDKCPKKHFNCMKLLTPEMVMDVVKKLENNYEL